MFRSGRWHLADHPLRTVTKGNITISFSKIFAFSIITRTYIEKLPLHLRQVPMRNLLKRRRRKKRRKKRKKKKRRRRKRRKQKKRKRKRNSSEEMMMTMKKRRKLRKRKRRS